MPKYLVLNEHTLGYRIDGWPETMGILHASVLKGSPHNDLDGWCIIVPGVSVLRPATEEDFKEYRVSLPPQLR